MALSKSLFFRMANFFIGLNRVRVPTKLFTSEEKAVEWLKEFSE